MVRKLTRIDERLARLRWRHQIGNGRGHGLHEAEQHQLGGPRQGGHAGNSSVRGNGGTKEARQVAERQAAAQLVAGPARGGARGDGGATTVDVDEESSSPEQRSDSQNGRGA